MRIVLFAALVLVAAGCSGPAPSAPPAGTATPAQAPGGGATAPAAAPSTPPVLDAAPSATAPVAVPAAAPEARPAAPAGGSPSAAPVTPPRRGAPPAPAPAAPAAAPAPAAPPLQAAAPPPAPVAAPAPAVPAPQYREITIPAGTTLSVALTSAHASDTSTVEEAVRGTLRRALTVDGDEALPAGTLIGGSVIEAVPSGRVKGLARLAIRFTSVTLEEEELRIATEAIAREAQPTKGKDAAKIGIGAGAGAVVGAITGGKKGAVVGGAIGAGAGTGVVLATKGEEVRMPAGTAVTVRLREPFVIRQRVR